MPYGHKKHKQYNNGGGTIKAQWIPAANAYKCHFTWHKNLKTFLDVIKSKVPTNDREYDPDDNHAWYLTEPYFDIFLPLMREVFADCTFEILTKQKVEEYNQGTATTLVVSTDKLAEEFFKMLEKAGLQPDRTTLEENKVKRDYRLAARYYHPDYKPENASQMSRLNELWASLKGVYFK